MYNKFKHLAIYHLNLIFCFIFSAKLTLANNETIPPTIPDIETLPGPQGDVSQVSGYLQNTYFPRIAFTVVTLATAIAVTSLIIGAIQFLTAYGNEEKLGTAKKTITFSLVGVVISILSYAIVQLIFTVGYTVPR